MTTMKRFAFGLLCAFVCAPLVAQEDAGDEVSKQAATIEAQLGKFKDSAPEAAEAMVKLTDLYHQDGRLFGLVRVAQQFVTSHPTDARQKAVMLKLIDGQEGLSRNKEVAATIRQFISRYPDAAENAALEMRLADALQQLDDRLRSAEACRAVWKRQGPSENGRRYGVAAVRLFSSLNNPEGMTQAGTLGEEMLDKLPVGEFAREVGVQAFHDYRRMGGWAKSTAVGTKMLQKGLGGEPETLRQLHMYMAENYGNVGQHMNAAQSLIQARAIRDDQFVHYNIIYRLYHGAAKPQELEPLAKEYFAKYPTRQDRFHGVGYTAISCINNGEKPRGVAMLVNILADDPVTNSNASIFVRENGAEPPQLADSEQKLVAAIAQNKPGVTYLRYVLAFDLYRDRVKDNAKAKQVLRELISQTPSDDGHTSGAVDWLLYNSADENEFKNDLNLVLEARKKHPHIAHLRDSVKNWAQNARQNKDYAAKANIASEELKKHAADPLLTAFTNQVNSQHGPGEAIREQLLKSPQFEQLSETSARYVLQSQADWYRHYAPGNKRGEMLRIYQQYAKRFPQDYAVAQAWLETAIDYGKPADAKPAADHLLKFPPENAYADMWRRLLMAAERTNNDPALAKQTWDWMQQAQTKFGRDSQYAATIGDYLLKAGMEKEAVEHWTVYLTANRQSPESRECASRLLGRIKEPPQRIAFIQELVKHNTDLFGRYSQWLADEYLKAGDIANFERVLKEAQVRQAERPFQWGDFEYNQLNAWLDGARANKELKDDVKTKIVTVIRDLGVQPTAASAELALLENTPVPANGKTPRLLALQRATRIVGNDWYDWDRLAPFALSAVGRKDYVSAAVLSTGMLANIPQVDEPRKKVARDLITQSLSRIGGVGLTIDDSSPLAPLLQAAMYFRLGDERLAFDTYLANKKLFQENRNQLPPDLLMFVCERLIAANTDADHDYVEEILRGWMVQFSENMQQEATTKAKMQLLLAKNFFKAQRYDVARAEYNTVVNRYADTPQAIEAEFGIGETYLSQKVFDQAELVFEKLARSAEIDVVVRAEFLRGVLAFRRGDREEARDIFRGVLERVPNVELANQALFNLAEVYGAEERYIDQLNLLRTVGRLGRASKRRHVPGSPLSIVVHDSDLGISRGHNRIPVKVTTVPGGDSETIYLVGSGAGKGLFRADLETRLGRATADDHVLQITGKDVIKCDYPDAFKSEFKNVPLSDVEIRVAADGKFEVSGSKIEDVKQETLSEELERAKEDERGDKRVSQKRPANQIKPGNPIYVRVKDGDRDLSDEVDQVIVKLTADSGDQIQVPLAETGPHTGIFEGTAKSGDLPAGALASDTGIDHSPLMAIDRDPKSYWISEPDGATPKTLTVDMKDLLEVTRVKLTTPDAAKNAPVRGEILGSQDGAFWFRLAGHPEREPAPALAAKYDAMVRRVYNGNHTDYTTWDQVVALSKNSKPAEEVAAESLKWQRPEDNDVEKPYTVLWQGKFVQPKSGAVRIAVQGQKTALMMDGHLEIPVGPGNRSIDLWLNAGTHDLAIFAAVNNGKQVVEATLARASLTAELVTLRPFRAADFDLTSAAAKKPLEAAAAEPIPLAFKDARFNKKTEKFGVQNVNNVETIGFWQAPEDTVEWDVEAPTAGPYEVWVELAHEGEGGRFKGELAGKAFETPIPNTGNWTTFRRIRAATVIIDKAGKQTLSLKPGTIVGPGLMDVKSVSLQAATGESVVIDKADWEFRFPARDLRFVRFVCREYLGEAVAISNVEVSGEKVTEPYIPTKEDVLALAANDTLEIAGGDTVTAAYTDEVTLNDSAGSQLLTGKLQATYFNANVYAIGYDFERLQNGAINPIAKMLKRVDPGERIVVEVIDYDEDRTDQRDTIPLQVQINDGPFKDFTATETKEFSGIFTKEIDTSAKEEKDKFQVKPGDRVTIRYLDTHNTFPGHSVPREEVVYVPEPTAAVVRVLETRVIPPPMGVKAEPQIVVLPKRDTEVGGVAFEAPITVEVIDPDAAKDSRSVATVKLTTSDGAEVEVDCHISSKFSDITGEGADRVALEEGRFIGQVILQLGGKSSPAVVPLTTEMPRNLVGKIRLGEAAAGDSANANLVTRVLNLTGKDIVSATYKDARHPNTSPEDAIAKGRLISNGRLFVTDRDYDKEVTSLHVGERLYLKVTDADFDTSDARDTATVEITTELGEKETVKLEETLSHSGVFTGSLQLKAVDKPTAENLDPSDAIIESYFGDKLTVRFVDPTASTETGKLEQTIDLPVVVGTDGLVAAFSKTFHDETLAVETRFRIAESYFELFKSHKQLAREDEKKIDLEAGRRVLREVMEDYPDPKYAPRISYLLGQFAQELEQWDEAIRSYDLILRQYAEHNLAPDAQYKLAQCYEQAGDFDQALEAYVTLAATHPKSPLIPNVMIRISDYFYKNEKYEIAAQVGEKFLERFESHSNAPRMAFRIGQCYYKAKKFQTAGKSFDKFTEIFGKDPLSADSFFWAGESYRMASNPRQAFISYNNCRWKHPDSEAAKYARGRLALPEMLQQFEAEANSVDEDK